MTKPVVHLSGEWPVKPQGDQAVSAVEKGGNPSISYDLNYGVDKSRKMCDPQVPELIILLSHILLTPKR